MIRVVLLSLFLAATAHAEPLKVGMVDMPPFSWTDDEGQWRGVAVDLWTQAASEAGLEWTPVKVNRIDTLIDQLASGAIDVAAAGLTVTPDRAERIEYLPAFEVTSLGIAAYQSNELRFSVLLTALADSAFLGLSLLVVCLVLFFGIAIWLAERRSNHEEFGGEHHQGLGSGLWWSMVTMSTVGYGDKSPRTWLGRTLAGVWIVLALVLVSVFTGAAASAFTHRTTSDTAHTWELRGKRVGALESGSTQEWLRTKGIKVVGQPSFKQGLEQVAEGEIDAFVGDVNILRWTMMENYIADLGVRTGLRSERLAFAVRPGLQQEHALNVALLRAMQSEEWSTSLQAHGWPVQDMLR
jgi:ABC-type amino acid transport substrate-binding protein